MLNINKEKTNSLNIISNLHLIMYRSRKNYESQIGGMASRCY